MLIENPIRYFEADADFMTYWQYAPFQGETHKIRVRISLLCTDTSYFLVVPISGTGVSVNACCCCSTTKGCPWKVDVSKQKNSRKYLGTIDAAIKEKMLALDHEMKR